MNEATRIANGLYRLVKREEDHNPVFPSEETVVEIRDGIVINLSTGRHWPLNSLGDGRELYGPIKNPYDLAPLERLPRIDLPVVAGEAHIDTSLPAEE